MYAILRESGMVDGPIDWLIIVVMTVMRTSVDIFLEQPGGNWV